MSLAAILQNLIHAGNDIQSIKYYASAGEALLFFDYLLTLPDEIQYAWKGKKTWIFYLFLLNRYVPILYEIWILVVVWWPGFTHEVCMHFDFLIHHNATLTFLPTPFSCNHTAWIEIAIFVFLTLVAQIFLTVRIYALTLKNKVIAAFFCGVTIPQLALGIYLVTLGATNPDLAAFTVIVGFGLKNGLNASAMAMARPNIVKTIVHDATIYFFVIFTSHLVFVLTLVFARPVLQLLPAVGNDVFLPIMISRLMLSLKKTATTENGWSFSEMTTARRADEVSSMHVEHDNRARPSLDGDRARKGFRTRKPEGLEEVPADVSEEIGMAITKSMEEPRVSGEV
ncbi:hypothetical protein BDM02DRAFT_3190024 [Thelephora ganbajun]|uniref:Uncharacterized protein n=1 Tax=Thelephora ganbajun TaxID=370292 RepID=A0ACB6Z6C6_THEGA|nr:hypothetical protein BDM02DRAFT_3190024 [Thelephora ganbajun]